LLWLAWAAPAAAQPGTAPGREDGPAPVHQGFLPRADFRFGWASLLAADQRFDWQGEIGFDLDIVGRGTSRLRLRGDYQGVLGRERRRYDLNHGNYSFEISGATAIGRAEVAAISQHVSRHLSDRDNVPAISWNTIGVRVASAWTSLDGLGPRLPSTRDDAVGATRVDGEVEISRAMQQAYVDYAWISRARVSWRRAIAPAVALTASATGEVIGVTREVLARDRVCGGRIEGGVRIRGRAAALEAFAGYERRIDAYPTDRFRVRFFTAGIRVTTLSGG
jgi:hypothetical protein